MAVSRMWKMKDEATGNSGMEDEGGKYTWTEHAFGHVRSWKWASCNTISFRENMTQSFKRGARRGGIAAIFLPTHRESEMLMYKSNQRHPLHYFIITGGNPQSKSPP